MDILAHGLWTNIVYRILPPTKNNLRIMSWGILFGILPDIISFGPYFAVKIWDSLFFGKPFLSGPPDIEGTQIGYLIHSLYNYTHSLIIWAAVALLIWLIIKKIPWPLLGWGLHIGIDIFSHTDKFFATPFLFPISDFQVSAISWADPKFMIVNYSLLLIFYIISCYNNK